MPVTTYPVAMCTRQSVLVAQGRKRSATTTRADAVPKVQLGDGCARGWGQFEERDVQGLIPQTGL
jgi:hypothetical protein